MNLADQISLAEGKWRPIPRIARVIPFGYKVEEDNPNLLIPVPIELEALEQAKKFEKRYSYRDLAEWITAVTGRSISGMGLHKRLEIERKRKTAARTIRGWTKRVEEAKARVETFEKERLGAQADSGSPVNSNNT